MLRPTLIISTILLAGCVSEEDVRTQVDQSAAAIRQELAAARNDSTSRTEKLTAELGTVRSESTARDDKLAADSAARDDKLTADLAAARTANDQRLQTIEQLQKTVFTDLAAVKTDLQRISGDLGRTVQDLQRRIDASSGVLRDTLQRQRASIADQLKSIDQIIGGFDTGTPTPAAPTAPAPAPR